MPQFIYALPELSEKLKPHIPPKDIPVRKLTCALATHDKSALPQLVLAQPITHVLLNACSSLSCGDRKFAMGLRGQEDVRREDL